MKIHLFNPENDLALGLGCRHYTPPPHAAAIHRAGALLPLWWAEAGDLVLAPDSLKAEARELAARFGLSGEVGNPADASEALPWGWSPDAKRQFLNAGVREEILPSDAEIERMRLLSHRRMSIEIISRLNGDYPIPIETTDADEVVERERATPGCFIKSPWSGSGRGVFCARSLDTDALRRRAEGIIHRQGSVMVERGLDKAMDFAALFYSDGKRVEIRGLSIFSAEARGMYSGNIVAPQDFLRQQLAGCINIAEVDAIVSQEEEILTELVAKSYRGWMGADMMAYRREDDGRMAVMPCVELNLRMTMGVVALKIAEKLAVDTPHFLAWEHNKTAALDGADGLTLLPPSDGFALRLTPIAASNGQR